MSGSYPNVPGQRMAWDDDGSVAVIRNTSVQGAFVDLGANKATLNDESFDPALLAHSLAGGTADSLWELVVIFPELREIDGIFAKVGALNTADHLQVIDSSVNTTNGIDGTWTTQIASYTDVAGVTPEYRNNIISLSATGQRAVRVNRPSANANGSEIRAIHVYGVIAPGQTPDRLLFIDDTTGLEFIAAKDYGDIPRGSARDFTFKLKNNSASLTASTVQFTTEALTGASAAWYTYDIAADGLFQSTRSITSIGAAALSAAIRCRQDIPDAEVLGLHAARIQASVGSWA